jgi:hypothetical protein
VQGLQVKRMLAAALVLGSITGVSLAASAWGKDKAISGDTTATNLSVASYALVWSRESPAGTHRLVAYDLGLPLLSQPQPKDVEVRTSSSLFDPDVGVSSKGRSVVVYTRCGGLSGQNCDIYSFDGKAESKVKGAATSRCSEFAPSIWKGIIAFARRGSKRCNGLYLKGKGPALRLDKRVPADTDIRGNRIAYLYTPSARQTAIRIIELSRQGGGSQIVVSGVRSGGERTRVTNPTFSGRYVYFLLEDLRRSDFLVGRSRGGRGSVLEFSDRKLPGDVDSIGVEKNFVYYTNGKGVHRMDDPLPKFSPRD